MKDIKLTIFYFNFLLINIYLILFQIFYPNNNSGFSFFNLFNTTLTFLIMQLTLNNFIKQLL